MSSSILDITRYGDNELVDYFINDEGLYILLEHSSTFSTIEYWAGEFFVYNEDQLEELKSYWSSMELEAGE